MPVSVISIVIRSGEVKSHNCISKAVSLFGAPGLPGKKSKLPLAFASSGRSSWFSGNSLENLKFSAAT